MEKKNIPAGNFIGTIVAGMFKHQVKYPTYKLAELLYNHCFSPASAGEWRGELLSRAFCGKDYTAGDVNYCVRGSLGGNIAEEAFAVIPSGNIIVMPLLGGGKVPRRMLRAYAEAVAEAFGGTPGAYGDAPARVRLIVFGCGSLDDVFGSGGICPFRVVDYECRRGGGWAQKITAHFLTEGEKITRSVDRMQRTREQLNAEKQEVMLRMDALDITAMEGVNCTYHLQKGKISRRCNIDLLAKDYPQAYQACVTHVERVPYLIVNRKKKSE